MEKSYRLPNTGFLYTGESEECLGGVGSLVFCWGWAAALWASPALAVCVG